ncbi:MAG TPA: molybdopterin-binding protein, partial [Isosphaeraceae bacterium]|nr:molybdopterin-binding protein [Isosphaeraceae bacterium]
MSQSVSEHRSTAPSSLRLAVLTISDTRTLETDTSGALILELAQAAGHSVVERAILPDEPAQMHPLLTGWTQR